MLKEVKSKRTTKASNTNQPDSIFFDNMFCGMHSKKYQEGLPKTTIKKLDHETNIMVDKLYEFLNGVDASLTILEKIAKQNNIPFKPVTEGNVISTAFDLLEDYKRNVLLK